jgi:membrane protein YqaA with SNARE-associated domain
MSFSDKFLEFWGSFGELGLFFYSILETITPLAGVEFFFLTLIGENPWWRLALITTAANAVGATIVYFFLAHGSMFYKRMKTDNDKKKRTTQLLDKYGFLAIYIVAMTPLPFFLILLVAALARMDFKVYLASTIISRGLRFFVTTYIMHQFTQFSTFEIILILTLISIPIILVILLLKKFVAPYISRLLVKNNTSCEKATVKISSVENLQLTTDNIEKTQNINKPTKTKNKPVNPKIEVKPNKKVENKIIDTGIKEKSK